MKKWYDKEQKGQTLVILALSLTVLMLMAGLAVDIGMAYNDHRDMQNAADAAALEGARLLCKGKTQAEIFAASTAIGTQNGATTVTTTLPTADSVRAVAATDADTFFFRIAGVHSVPVSAAATAECACAGAIGNAWPIAFDLTQWGELGCMKANGTIVGTSPYMMVWVDDNVDQDLGEDFCIACDCTRLHNDLGITSIMAWGGDPFGPGDRGWVKLMTPPGFEGTVWEGQDCEGADTLKFWMLYGYPGLVAEGKCVPTKSGVNTSVLHAGTDGTIPKDVGILIYYPDPEVECTNADAIGCTNKDMLKIAESGCIRINAIYYDFLIEDKPGVKPDCYKNNGQ